MVKLYTTDDKHTQKVDIINISYKKCHARIQEGGGGYLVSVTPPCSPLLKKKLLDEYIRFRLHWDL